MNITRFKTYSSKNYKINKQPVSKITNSLKNRLIVAVNKKD